MAKNEMMLLTQEAINGLANKELKKEVTNYVTAGASINNSRWLMAEAIYNVVSNELFDEDFETDTEFYNFVNIKKSNASQLVNAVRFMKKQGLDYNAYTVGKAYALSTLTDEEFEEFMIYCNENDICTHSMTDKALVELIKEWKMSQLEEIEEVAEEQESAEEEQEIEELDEKASMIAQIKETMERYNITIEDLM